VKIVTPLWRTLYNTTQPCRSPGNPPTEISDGIPELADRIHDRVVKMDVSDIKEDLLTAQTIYSVAVAWQRELAAR
jgi:hypothetical protein